jgi:hypothetical protein
MNPAEEYILKLPQPYREVALQLQLLIESNFPELLLKFKWRLPFYYLNEQTMFCFINYRKTFVDLGMPYGDQLMPADYLIAGENRKSLRSLRYKNIEDIDTNILLSTLQELKSLRLNR